MKSVYFPSRLFRWFLSRQIFYFAVFLVAFLVVLLSWLELGGFEGETLWVGRILISACFGSALITWIVVSWLMARKIVMPLGRLIDKARRLRDFPVEGEGFELEELTFDGPGEWFELERALNRLGRDLRQKTIRLSREKTELRAIMAAVTEAVLAVRKDQKVLFFNPQFTFLFGLQTGKSDATLSEVLRSPDLLEAYNETLRTGVTTRREVEITVQLERSPRDFVVSIAPLRKKHNQELYGAVGIFHDITELKRVEKIRIDFVGNVSHELRTPLTVINGYLQTLTQDFAQGRLEQAQEFLTIVAGNVTRLKSLVEDLLDLSALESGKELEVEKISVRELTEGVLAQLNVHDHKVSLQFDLESIEGDGKRVEQVLRNLMENAVRYVPRGGNINVRWHNEGQDVAILEVQDNGPGIAPEHQSRLFERFYRVDEGRARSDGGTGIGLSLVKHIMQKHGGRVYVSSRMGEGAKFVCEFPRQARRLEGLDRGLSINSPVRK